MAEKKKRYSIVRVDDYRCIKVLERIKWNCGCFKSCGACQKSYGDTKEQLIQKIITAVERAGIDYVQLSKEEIAKEIVKYLGVK